MDNEKQQRFHKIAEARTNRVINDIRLLSNCANRNNYAYTPEEVTHMLRAIDEAVRDLKIAFAGKENTNKTFKFKK